MKRSSSTSMICELQNDLAGLSTGGSMRKGRANSGGGGSVGSSIPNGILGGGLKNKKHLSSSNASLPGDLTLSRPWASPRRQPIPSPLPFMRINSPTSRTHRVEQLRKEESVDERKREEAGEREFTEQLQLNHSCHELKLDDDENDVMMETVPATIPFISPSSPILPNRMRSRSLTPTSPSSTRTFSYSRMRSCSPILRPSTLCIDQTRKRKRNDQEEMDVSPTHPTPNPAKRAMFASPLTLSPCVSPLSCSSPLHHSSMESRPAFDPPAIPYESPPDSLGYMVCMANPTCSSGRHDDAMDMSCHMGDVLSSSPGCNSGVRGVALAPPPTLEVPSSLSYDRNHHHLKLGGMKRKLAPRLTLQTPVNSHHGNSAFLPVSRDQGARSSRSGYITLNNSLTPPSEHKQAVGKPENSCASDFYAASSRPVTTIT